MAMISSRQTGAPPALRPSDVRILFLVGAVLLLALAALLAVGVASFLFGGGWVWPSGVTAAVAELGGVLRGHPGQGLSAADAHRVPGSFVVYIVVALIELIAIVAAVVLARMAMGIIRPSDSRAGLASRTEAARALGRERLTRQRAAEIRPDLYGKRRHVPEGSS